MIAAERQKTIIGILDREGIVTIPKLRDALEVSAMTVRRDLLEMEERGMLKRVRGGAQSLRPAAGQESREQTFVARMHDHAPEKRRIGEAAAELIEEGQSVFLDGSSTCVHMTRFLMEFTELTVVTDSLAVVRELSAVCDDLDIIVLGGALQSDGNTIDGPMALESAERLRVGMLFFSCSGFDADGVYNAGLIGTNAKKALIQKAQKRVLLAHSSKYGTHDFYTLCPANTLDILVTDSGLPEEAQRLMRAQGIEVIIADG